MWSSYWCAGLGVLVQGRYGDTFGGIRGGHWDGRAGFGGGCTACARVFVCVGIGFHRSIVSGRYVSGVHSLFVRLLAGGDWFRCALALRCG